MTEREDIDLENKGLKKIQKFSKELDRGINCRRNKLTSLEGSPKKLMEILTVVLISSLH